jgi:hypothetical protein
MWAAARMWFTELATVNVNKTVLNFCIELRAKLLIQRRAVTSARRANEI